MQKRKPGQPRKGWKSAARKRHESGLINIRVTKDEKAWLAEVAKTGGVTLSGFLRVAALEEARRILARRDSGDGLDNR